MDIIRSHRDLKVYQLSFDSAMEIFEISKSFPKEERYSLSDQIRRSSRSVSANIAEALRKRKYPKSFIAKLSDAEGESAETQTWIDFALHCKYIENEVYNKLNGQYEHIIAMIITIYTNLNKWTI